jgi:hypothetical protein
MIKAQIKIGSDGEFKDTYDTYGLCYIEADKTVGPSAKDFEATSYPEEEGENILPKSVDEAFDFKVVFLVEAHDDLGQVAARVKAFNAALYAATEESDTKEFKQVSLQIPTRNITVVGYPKPISSATDYWYDSDNNKADAALVEFTIRVNKPSLCTF